MKVPFVVLFLLVGFKVVAQVSEYESGYIIANKDTIQGYVERTDEVALSRSINFKENLSSEKKVYLPEDISGFGFKESDLAFEPVLVEIRQDSIKKDVRFAKVMLTGVLSLYYLQLADDEIERIFLNDNSHVFIVKRQGNDQVPAEYHTLSQYEYQIDKRVGVRKLYVGVLKFLLEDYLVKTKEDIDKLKFQDDDIIGLINRYNNYESPGIKTTKHSYKVKPVIKRGGEISFGMLTTTGHNVPTIVRPGNTPVQDSYGLSLGYFWDVLNPNISKSVSTCFGASYLNLQYKYKETASQTVNVTQHSLRFPILAQVNFTQFISDKPSFFFNGGPVFEVFTNKTFDSISLRPQVGLGFGMYYSRLKFSLSTDNSGFSLNSDKFIRFSVGITQKQKAKRG